MDELTSETCWALNNEIIKQVTSSWSLFIRLYPINIRNFKCLHLGCRPKSSFRVSTARRCRPFLFAWYHFISSKPTIKTLHRWPCHKLCAGASVRYLSQPLQYNCSSNISVQPKIKKETETICTIGFFRTFLLSFCLVTYLPQGAGKKQTLIQVSASFKGAYPTNRGVCRSRHSKRRILWLALDTGSVIFSFRAIVSCFFYSYMYIMGPPQ